MLKTIVIIIIFLIWFFGIIKNKGLSSELVESIHALKDGYGGIFGIVAIFLFVGIPVCLLIWLFV